ncbi:MAG: glutamine--fructose-6-phosphate transaminase (isomerizing) [Robiginitomaculum sp.]|nr:MAG: glutamine--fructose-6-phosphate transaminase (isomerizing) [Robiginitomaculum sp.]
MCGIVGIVSNRPVSARLVEGLIRLEYRGYDSAGIAVINGQGIVRRRAPGKIINLQHELDSAPIDGTCGIAHTRWATHGRPNMENAHPHRAGNVAIVHNGIIENFKLLHEELAQAGHVFVTQTDSEVIAHLIQHYLDKDMDEEAAFLACVERLEGAYAVAALVGDANQTVYAARHGSPLVVGFGDGEMFIGSDAFALAPFTKRVLYLEEGDSAVVNTDDVCVRDQSGAPVTRKIITASISAVMAEKGNYRHFMEKEIHEQPEALARTMAAYIDPDNDLPILGNAGPLLAEADRLIAIACGTAYLAASVAKYWFEGLAGVHVETDIASEFRYRTPALPKNGAALFISQSGETADTLAAMRYCKQAGISTIGVLNAPESSIARETSAVMRTLAGPEIGVASTKAFTAQLAVLAMSALGTAHKRGCLNDDEVKAHIKALSTLPELAQKALAVKAQCEAIAPMLASSKQTFFIGRGVYYPLALEGALKLKEVTYLPAEGYAAGELKHGPIALIEEGTPVVVIAPTDELMEKTISNVEEMAARGAKIIAITDEAGAEHFHDRATHTIVLPDMPGLTGPIICAIPLQLLAYFTALKLGTNMDQPRNLAKSVTVE